MNHKSYLGFKSYFSRHVLRTYFWYGTQRRKRVEIMKTNPNRLTNLLWGAAFHERDADLFGGNTPQTHPSLHLKTIYCIIYLIISICGQIEDYRQFQYFEYCCSYILYIYFYEIGLICILMKYVFALRLWWAAWELKEGLGSKSILMRKLTAEKAEICNAHCTNIQCNSVKNTKYKIQSPIYEI